MRQRPVKRLSSLAAVSAAGLALTLAAFVVMPRTAVAQEPKGTFVDGEFVEGYVYVPDFMSPDELKGFIDRHSDRVVIVDTAAPLIWQEEHIPGAINFPWARTITPPVSLPRDKTLVLYCACKNHEDSADMAQKLSLLGYLDVKVLQGGWFKWVDLGYPTQGTAADDGRK